MSSLDLCRVGWRKSARSNGGGNACVEVAFHGDATWRKSSRSNGSGGECVEVAHMPGMTAVRDSKNPTGPALAFGPAEWAAFRDTVKSGRLDLS
ncbi:toxin [Longimycelium tulufanense]|uniref:Toxin n=1 Tax=Longimycelium tulufanense TaxID=907463 RepID=A0A8J3CCJ3_9PSEU|nr:DUF397 domain-containing protein [Longimycelium tulufanense]GGM53603.1 toxin [Longimycelium tulufanense]